MPKTLTMRLAEETYETFLNAAKSERRSLANLVETAALQHIRDNQFVDDREMAEIYGRPQLVRRLKNGSRDARRGKGRFAPAVSDLCNKAVPSRAKTRRP